METNNFQATIGTVKLRGFPKDDLFYGFKAVDSSESHSFKKDSKERVHSLNTYEFTERILGLEVLWSYNHCSICNKVRNQSVTVFHPEGREVFRHYFMRNGDE